MLVGRSINSKDIGNSTAGAFWLNVIKLFGLMFAIIFGIILWSPQASATTVLSGTIATNQSSNTILIGTAVKLTGQGTGGDGNYTYYYGYSDGASWNILNHPNPKDETASWTPTKPGTYRFAVDIYDGLGNKVTKWTSIYVPELAGSLNSNQLGNTVAIGTAVKLAGHGAGGDGNYTYYYGYSDGASWNILNHPNPKDETASWIPTKPGTYSFAVDIYDGTGAKVTKWQTIKAYVPAIGGSLSAGPSSTVLVNTSVTLVGQGTGGDGNYTYYYGYSDGSEWNIMDIKDPKVGTVSWTPTKPGTYSFAVDIYDGLGNKATRWTTIYVPELTGSLASNQLENTVAIGTPVKLTGHGTGGDGNYTYYFGFSDGTRWNIMDHPDPKDGTASWIPTKPGTYSFAVDIYDGTGAKVTKWQAIKVYVPAIGGSLSPASSSTVLVGATVTLVGQGTGGDGNYTYYYGYSDGSEWNIMNVIDPKSGTVSWTPTKPGTYSFAVDIYDGLGNKATRWTTIYVPSLAGTLKLSQPVAVVGGSEITLTAQATGGDGNYTYYFGYGDGSRWSILYHPDPKNSSVLWSPDFPGTYSIAVDIFDNTGAKATIWTTVTAVGPAKGIDVSYHQGASINWTTVKKSGISYAMIRTGYGKEDPVHQTDPYFEKNYNGVKQAGLKIGAYHFSYAMTIQEAQQEAQFCLGILNGRDLDLPVAFDVEDDPNSSIRLSSLTKQQLTDNIVAFCEAIKGAGYRPMIYASASWFNSRIDYSRISQYDIWVANWGVDKPSISVPYAMWQYTNGSSVNGINGVVDGDYCYKLY